MFRAAIDFWWWDTSLLRWGRPAMRRVLSISSWLRSFCLDSTTPRIWTCWLWTMVQACVIIMFNFVRIINYYHCFQACAIIPNGGWKTFMPGLLNRQDVIWTCAVNIVCIWKDISLVIWNTGCDKSFLHCKSDLVFTCRLPSLRSLYISLLVNGTLKNWGCFALSIGTSISTCIISMFKSGTREKILISWKVVYHWRLKQVAEHLCGDSLFLYTGFWSR